MCGCAPVRFVVGLHDATTLHSTCGCSWRRRTVLGGAEGPSLDPAVKRLAVPVADHGRTPSTSKASTRRRARSGAVIIWDEGTSSWRRT